MKDPNASDYVHATATSVAMSVALGLAILAVLLMAIFVASKTRCQTTLLTKVFDNLMMTV
jgi:hypothetical protein